ncbi:MAG TPA: serine/threonine-protein kinase, partial [Planctomycetota bacterium]|nr:serine/threonine-protein kinase [Planctomycetota bacterium]
MAAGAGDSDRLLAELLVEQGVVTREQAAVCLAEIESWRASGRSPVPTLGQILMERGHLSRAALEHATIKIQTPPSPPPAADLPPEVRKALENPANDVGSFVLLKLLGKGGMGEVHLAWEKKLARHVAVKFIQGQVEAQDRARFVREARIVAKLHHPNIAPVYELGERRGDPYIVMHYVQGSTIDRAPLDLAGKVRAIRDSATALHYAHEQGIVHRDIKPGNIMIAGDHVYVMDFGLARQHQVDSSLSQSGMVVGTPQFMSPEQAMGDTRGVGARSDVYSLGATLYALLTGRPPFQAENIIELLQKVVYADIDPPRRKNPEIPRDLETIVLKALDKDPDRRYASAEALA